MKLLLVALATALVLVGIDYWFSEKSIVEEEVADLTKAQEKQLETFLEMNRLLTTLATLAIGAMGAFVLNWYKDTPIPKGQLTKAVVGSFFGGVSIYLGYLSHGKVVWMLDNRFFNLFNPQVRWTSKGQFYSFLFAVVLLGAFCYHGLRLIGEEKEGKQK